jgi:uncharacterized protein YkwD
LPGRSALLALLATLTVMLGTGVAVALTAAPVSMAPADAGRAVSAAFGPAPSGTAGSPEPTASPGAPTSPATDRAPATTPPPSLAFPVENSPAPPPPVDNSITGYEDRVLAITNAEREAAGCGPLAVDERLRTAARGHSHDMAVNDYFSHTSLDGRSPSDRAREAGYSGGVGENIAMGYRTPEDVMRGWMNSDGHRRNLLRCSYSVIGVGLAYDDRGRPYWTQKFGSR